MLAVSTADGLNLLDPSSLGSNAQRISHPPFTSLVWSPEGDALFGAADGGVRKVAGDRLVEIVKGAPREKAAEITALAAREKGHEILFAQGNKVYNYDVSGKHLTALLEGHKPLARIAHLAVTPSSSHVASLTSTIVLVHCLQPPHSRTTLRAPSSSPFTCLTFSPHKRSTLLTGHADGQLLVWDITRPNAPIRKWKAVKGDVVDLSCSPFSKGLCAVAGRDGEVALIDVDKDKGVYRSIPFTVPLTSVAFVPSGASLVVGTEHGRLLHQSLRALDKPPVEVIVDANGGRIWAIAMNVSKTSKRESIRDLATLGTSEQKGEEDRPKLKPAPLSERSPNMAEMPRTDQEAAARVEPSSAEQRSLKKEKERGRAPNKPIGGGAFSPVRVGAKAIETGDISMQIPAPIRRVSAPRPPQQPSIPEDVPLPPSPPTALLPRPRTPPALLVARAPRPSRSSNGSAKTLGSPVLPSMDTSPVMPAMTTTKPRASPKGKERETDGDSGKGKGKEVDDDRLKKKEREKRKKVVLHTPTPSPLSSPPRAPSAGPSTLQPRPATTSRALVPSPRRPTFSPPSSFSPPDPTASGTQPSDMLRAALSSALMDWRAEASRATRNLHLDVLRTARSQKNEIRQMMQEYLDEVKELRKENEMLRRENERLRRGF